MENWWLAMCEILAVAGERRLKLGALLAWAGELERLGIAGFGWGVAWAEADGEVHCHRNPSSLAGDVEGMLALRDTTAISALVHLRRPSRLSTVQKQIALVATQTAEKITVAETMVIGINEIRQAVQ